MTRKLKPRQEIDGLRNKDGQELTRGSRNYLKMSRGGEIALHHVRATLFRLAPKFNTAVVLYLPVCNGQHVQTIL